MAQPIAARGYLPNARWSWYQRLPDGATEATPVLCDRVHAALEPLYEWPSLSQFVVWQATKCRGLLRMARR